MLLLIIGLVQGNILDNVFANYDAPYIHIPNDFHVVLGTERTSSPNLILVDYSTTQKACHIRVTVEMVGEVANAYINMTTNEVYLRRYRSLIPPQMQCDIYEGVSVSDKLQMQSGNNAIILEPDVVFHLMSMYMGTGDDDMARFELSSLLEGRNKAYALFDKKGNLDSIEFEFENKRSLKLYVIEDLEHQSNGDYRGIEFFNQMITKNFSTSLTKQKLLSEVFSDVNFYKYRSQSNTDQYTPPVKGFQIIKLRGPSRQSVQSLKSVKNTSVKKRHSQSHIRLDIVKHTNEQEDEEMHEKLLSLFEIDLNMRKCLELNHMIVQDRKPDPDVDLGSIRDELLLMICNTIDRIHQYIRANNLSRSNLKKAHKRTAIEIEHQFQELVNMLLTAIAKRDLVLAKVIENVWKLWCTSIEMILQNSKAESEYIQQEVLHELQQEAVVLKKEKEDIYQKYLETQEEINKLIYQHTQQINQLQYQLSVAKMELNDYKQNQEALSSLENATGTIKDVEGNLKDTNKLLSKIEENIADRDTQLYQTLKAVVQQHKMEKDSQMSKAQKLISQYSFHTLTSKQAIIAAEYFNHPFVQYLGNELQPCEEKQIQGLFVDWFNQECVKIQFGTHPAQQRLELISQHERKSNPESFVQFLNKSNSLQYLQNCVAYISGNMDMNDLNSLSKPEKFNRQFCIFFGIILQFDVNGIEMDIQTYDRIRYLYAGLQQTSQEESTQLQNKLPYYNFVLANLSDLCNSIYPEYQERAQNQQQTVVQILIMILQGESDKRKQIARKLLDEYKAVDVDMNQQKTMMQKLVNQICNYHNQQYNETQVMIYAQALLDRYIKIYITGKRRNGLEIGEWINFTSELFYQINKMVLLKPHLHWQVQMLEDLIYVNKEFQINQRTTHLERRESQIRKK